MNYIEFVDYLHEKGVSASTFFEIVHQWNRMDAKDRAALVLGREEQLRQLRKRVKR